MKQQQSAGSKRTKANISPDKHQRRPSSQVDDDAPQSSASSSASRPTRLSRACDGCSLRKVKCDEEGPPCRACRSLNIVCTFDRPSRRRGPLNRSADALRQRWPSLSSLAPAQEVGMADPLDAGPTVICPLELLHLLVDDFFVYVYPLVPFPHETWFRAQLLQSTEPRFLALLSSVVAAVCASHSQRLLQHSADLGLGSLFATPSEFVERCRRIATQARGTMLLSAPDLSVWDAITSFFLAQTHSASGSTTCELFLGESFNILRTLGYGRQSAEDSASMESENPLLQQMGQRLYWSIFKVARANMVLAQGGGITDIAISPPTAFRKHPPIPAAVDDASISADGIAAPPVATFVPSIVGFNSSVRLYLSLDPLLALESSYAIDEMVHLDTQTRLLARALSKSQTAYAEAMADFSRDVGLRHDLDLNADHTQDPGARHAIATALQRADVHISYLIISSYVLEKYWFSRSDAAHSPLGTPLQDPSGMVIPLHSYLPGVERLKIAAGMLGALEHTPMLLQNGFAYHLSLRIRQIASTLLEYTASDSPVASLDISEEEREEARQMLREFVRHLTRLDQVRAAASKER